MNEEWEETKYLDKNSKTINDHVKIFEVEGESNTSRFPKNKGKAVEPKYFDQGYEMIKDSLQVE